MGKCKHTSVIWSEWHDGAWEVRGRLSGPPLESHGRFFPGKLVCDCGAWLSLGESNDAGEHAAQVAVEIVAASIAAGEMKPTELHERGIAAWLSMSSRLHPRLGEDTLTWRVGWLAAAIIDHEEPLTLDEVKSALAIGAAERKAAERYRRKR